METMKAVLSAFGLIGILMIIFIKLSLGLVKLVATIIVEVIFHNNRKQERRHAQAV